jgi:glucose/arabinose dehydrogenase
MRAIKLNRTTLIAVVLAALCGGCGARARLDINQGIGPNPQLPEPQKSAIPTINVVTAKGWSESESPVPADGARVVAFARGLDHPRWLHVLANGDVLVAETNAPPRPDEGKGIKGYFFKKFQAKAGGAVPSANRITLLRDADGDGVAEVKTAFLEGLQSPFGMAVIGDTLYIANAGELVRVAITPGETRAAGQPVHVTDLPGGTINHHWTKSLIASPDGSKLYVGIGSNSNVAENGIDKETDRACIWEIDPKTGTHRTFASGLRNPVGMAWEPETNALWVAVNERDELGSDLVPDYITGVRDGAF